MNSHVYGNLYILGLKYVILGSIYILKLFFDPNMQYVFCESPICTYPNEMTLICKTFDPNMLDISGLDLNMHMHIGVHTYCGQNMAYYSQFTYLRYSYIAYDPTLIYF